MAKKCKCPPPGAPQWVMTYGDMMSLLLVFFIMLVALSEIKEEDKYRAIVESVQRHFGMTGGAGKMPVVDDPDMSLIERLKVISLRQQQHRQHASTDDPGIEGRHTTVTRIRESMMFAVGGRITFEPGSADLSDRARRQLRQEVAELIRGYNNKIELRGHAASDELEPDRPYEDLWSLSYARARAVMEYLISDEIGIRSNRIRLVANADREPLAKKVWTVQGTEPNRRVEILVSQALVEDFTRPELSRSN